MRHEKIIKRPDGSKVNICVNFYTDGYRSEFKYDVTISICEPRKRTLTYVNDCDNYTWRNLSHEERKKYNDLQNLKYASIEEIQTAKEELWQLLKPT